MTTMYFSYIYIYKYINIKLYFTQSNIFFITELNYFLKRTIHLQVQKMKAMLQRVLPYSIFTVPPLLSIIILMMRERCREMMMAMLLWVNP
jgi:hypothetical protein